MTKLIPTVVIGTSPLLTLEEFCQALHSQKEFIVEMIEYQVIQPHGQAPEEWRFDSNSLRRGRIAANFYQELEINMPGIALVLELLDKIEDLQHQVKINGLSLDPLP